MTNKSWPWPKSSYTITNTSAENTAQVPTNKQTVTTLKNPEWLFIALMLALLFVPLFLAASL